MTVSNPDHAPRSKPQGLLESRSTVRWLVLLLAILAIALVAGAVRALRQEEHSIGQGRRRMCLGRSPAAMSFRTSRPLEPSRRRPKLKWPRR